MTVIKNVDVISWAKIHALFGIVAGLIYGVILAVFGAAIGLSHDRPGIAAFGLLSIVIMPIVCGIMAFVCGAIMAFLYNIFTGRIGGIVVTLEKN